MTYDLGGLSAKGKVRLLQRLYGRRSGKYLYGGLLSKLRGFKVGRGYFAVPLRSLREALAPLDEAEYLTS